MIPGVSCTAVSVTLSFPSFSRPLLPPSPSSRSWWETRMACPRASVRGRARHTSPSVRPPARALPACERPGSASLSRPARRCAVTLSAARASSTFKRMGIDGRWALTARILPLWLLLHDSSGAATAVLAGFVAIHAAMAATVCIPIAFAISLRPFSRVVPRAHLTQSPPVGCGLLICPLHPIFARVSSSPRTQPLQQL